MKWYEKKPKKRHEVRFFIDSITLKKQQNIHVYPINDRFEHNTESNLCLCNPRVEPQLNGTYLIIHNSFDGREYLEDKTLLIN